MIETLRQKGGRAYALGLAGMLAVIVVTVGYLSLLGVAVLYHGLALTADLVSPIAFGVIGLAGLGGAPQLPNIAERWGGNQLPSIDEEEL